MMATAILALDLQATEDQALALSVRILKAEFKDSDKYANCNLCEKKIETMFFEAEWHGKLFQMKVFCAVIDSDQFSSKSELSL